MAWSLINTTASTTFTGASTFNVTIPAVTSGDILTVGILVQSVAASTMSVTDNKSNTYNVIGAGNPGTGNVLVCFVSNALITNGPATVTINSTGTWTGLFIRIDEWSPPASTTAIAQDGNHYNTGFAASATLVNDSTFTTTSNGDLAVSYVLSNTSTANTAAGWTATSAATSNMCSEYQIQSTHGAIGGSWTVTGSWEMGTFAISATTASATPDMGGSAAIYRVQVPGWRWRMPPKGYTRRNGILLKAA